MYLSKILTASCFLSICSHINGMSDLDVYGEAIAQSLSNKSTINQQYIEEALDQFKYSRHVQTLKGKNLKEEFSFVCRLIEKKIESNYSVDIQEEYKEFMQNILAIKGEPTEATVILLKNILNYL